MGSKLQLASRCPLAPKLRGNDIMGKQPAGIGVGESSLDLLDDVEVIHDIVEAAIIGQPSSRA